MGGLREAVASGQVDERFLEAARRAARSRVCSRPPPTGSPDWSNEDIDDLVFETISRVEPNQIVLAANEAVNDVQFVGWLRKAILYRSGECYGDAASALQRGKLQTILNWTSHISSRDTSCTQGHNLR